MERLLRRTSSRAAAMGMEGGDSSSPTSSLDGADTDATPSVGLISQSRSPSTTKEEGEQVSLLGTDRVAGSGGRPPRRTGYSYDDRGSERATGVSQRRVGGSLSWAEEYEGFGGGVDEQGGWKDSVEGGGRRRRKGGGGRGKRDVGGLGALISDVFRDDEEEGGGIGVGAGGGDESRPLLGSSKSSKRIKVKMRRNAVRV